MTAVSTTPVSANYLPAEPRAEDLRRHTVRGGAFTVGSQITRALIQTGATAVLGRLLLPADYGVVAMVSVVTGFITLFKDLGLSMATVQRKDLTHEQVNALFWINVAASAVLAVLTAAAAPLLAWFYDEPRVIGITLALAGLFLLAGVTAQHRAMLRRQMRFGALGVSGIAAMAVGMGVAVLLAWWGAGYWSLVAMMAARELTNLVFHVAQSGFRPGWPRRASGLRSMLTFGANLTGFNIVNYLVRNFDNLLIARVFGAAALGLYSKAYALLLMPIQQITQPIAAVVLPALCRLQDKPAQYRSFYLKGVMLVVLFSMPVVVATLVLAESVVLTLLGPNWMGAVMIYRVLALAAIVDTINMAPGWAFVSLGQTGRQFRWQIFETAVTILGFVIGLKWGPVGVAAGFSIVRCALRIPVMRYALHGSPVSLRDVGGVVWRPSLASALAAIPVYFADTMYWDGLTAPARLAAGLALFGLLYLATYVLVLPGGREEIWSLQRIYQELRGKGGGKPRAECDEQPVAEVVA